MQLARTSRPPAWTVDFRRHGKALPEGSPAAQDGEQALRASVWPEQPHQTLEPGTLLVELTPGLDMRRLLSALGKDADGVVPVEALTSPVGGGRVGGDIGTVAFDRGRVG